MNPKAGVGLGRKLSNVGAGGLSKKNLDKKSGQEKNSDSIFMMGERLILDLGLPKSNQLKIDGRSVTKR